MLIKKLDEKGLLNKNPPPSWMGDNIHYLTIMGSYSYGCNNTDSSDYDMYGVVIPPKYMLLPHLEGYIMYSDNGEKTESKMWKVWGTKSPPCFSVWNLHHVVDAEARKEYDFSIHNIVNYFQLLMDNNPNVIDSVYTAQDCVQHCTAVGSLIRENRDIFLHKGCWHKFKNYAISQLHKMTTKEPIGKRVAIREEYGFDVKFAYNVVRLLAECEMILMEGTLDLRRNREQLKSIRRGDMSEKEIREWVSAKELQLEVIYSKSKLQDKPDEDKIKQLLMNCLEHHYGNLGNAIVNPDAAVVTIRDIQRVIDNFTRSAKGV